MSATFTDVIRSTGMDRPAERVQWLLMTWDLAVDRGKANKYYRFFLTDDCVLVTNGQRSEKVFADEKPLRGRMAFSRFNDDRALEGALTMTASKLAGEYAMVCRPLAEDQRRRAPAARAAQQDPHRLPAAIPHQQHPIPRMAQPDRPGLGDQLQRREPAGAMGRNLSDPDGRPWRDAPPRGGRPRRGRTG